MQAPDSRPAFAPAHHLQASLPALRRRRGGGGSPPRRQHRSEATTGLLRGYYESSCYEATTGYYEAASYQATTRLLPGYYQATTRILPGYYQATTRSRARATWPAAPQQQPSSSAGAAHASNSEPAPTIRTPVERTRGGRPPHAEQAGQLRRPSAPHLLVQQDAVGVQPSLHSDLADEDEHVERAGLGQVDHDGAVHDRQAPTPASSNHVACAGQHPVAP